ncbi:DUF4430 domain-containing protein [Brevibacillus migulae]|uniref:DUF4430 domain-containing protein n=1 Tax=Brevibacillus migulae TaxID=1644114 RepID=UPI00106E6C0D|nr:DUF4430 domain-containing protein [Brevibacillus migulae]
MKRKEWLLLIVALLVLTGAVFGLITYRGQQESAKQSEQMAQGSQPQAMPEGPYAHLWITRDFGAQVLQQQTVPLQNEDTVMDVLKRNGKNVETAYGGGFVTTINGLASEYKPGDGNSKQIDWFYSVNGVLADIGAAEYPVNTGDIIWWDYHDWSYAVSTPAQIGGYPQLFTAAPADSGQDLVIMAAQGYEDQANQLAAALSKQMKTPPTVAAWDEQKLQEAHGFLLIGDKSTLGTSAFLQSLWKEKATMGLFAEMNQEGIHLYDTRGKMTRSVTEDDAGLLLATVHPQHRLPIVVVAGNGTKGVTLGVEKLFTQHDDPTVLKGYFGVLLQGDKTIRLPDQPAGGEQQ